MWWSFSDFYDFFSNFITDQIKSYFCNSKLKNAAVPLILRAKKLPTHWLPLKSEPANYNSHHPKWQPRSGFRKRKFLKTYVYVLIISRQYQPQDYLLLRFQKDQLLVKDVRLSFSCYLTIFHEVCWYFSGEANKFSIIFLHSRNKLRSSTSMYIPPLTARKFRKSNHLASYLAYLSSLFILSIYLSGLVQLLGSQMNHPSEFQSETKKYCEEYLF